MKQGKYVVIDLETTGPISETNYIIDIGIAVVEKGKITKKFESLVKPLIPVPPSITRLTGITNEDLESAPRFHEIIDEVDGFFKDAVFAAHNAPFDYGFLSLEFLRRGRKFARPFLCTKELAHQALPEQTKLGLDALMEHFKIKAEVRHRALPDAEITAKVLMKLFEVENSDELLKQLTILPEKNRIQMPSAAEVKRLPHQAGIYRFLSKEGETLFIGSSSNIHDRVLIHFVAQIENKKEAELCQRLDHIETRVTPSELAARLQDAKEVYEKRPKYNRLLKEWYPGAYLWVSQEDYPQIFLKDKPSHSDHYQSLGPVYSARLLDRLLEYGKNLFRLCDLRLGRLRHPRRFPGKHACHGHNLKRCQGACVGEVSAKDYQKLVNEMIRFVGQFLPSQEEKSEIFLKALKKQAANEFPGGWKERRSLTRLIKEGISFQKETREPFLIEEPDREDSGIKSLNLIQEGVLKKSWTLDQGSDWQHIEEEIRELLETPIEKDEEEKVLERLVIQNYLNQPYRTYKTISLR